MKKKKITQRMIAAWLGCSPQFMSAYLKGDREPSFATARKWEALSHIPLSAIAENEDMLDRFKRAYKRRVK